MNELVSVIIPVYNGEKHISRCLESLIKQSYENIELVVIDDGSTDGSEKICDYFAQTDSRIIVFHLKNSGVSNARNVGIDNARGELICFVDSDDYVDIDFVKIMSDKIINNDIAICGFNRVKETNQSIKLLKSGELTEEEVIYHSICTNIISGSCCNKIFKSEIINKFRLRFSNEIYIGEDTEFLLRYYKICSTFQYVNLCLYNYVCNSDSVIQIGYNKRNFDLKRLTCLISADKLEELYSEKNELIKKYIGYRKVRFSIWLLFQLIISNTFDNFAIKKIQLNCRRNAIAYISLKESTKLQKITALGACLSTKCVFFAGKTLLRLNKNFFIKQLK